jgi:hypothetical protein
VEEAVGAVILTRRLSWRPTESVAKASNSKEVGYASGMKLGFEESQTAYTAVRKMPELGRKLG